MGERLFKQVGCASCHIPQLPLDREGWLYSEPNPYNPYGHLRVGQAQTFVLNLNRPDLPAPRLTARDGVTMVPAFTDLKLHDITSGPGDPNREAVDMQRARGTEMHFAAEEFFAGNGKFITRRLWGVASKPNFYHHGKFTTMREAVLAHAGEAQRSTDSFKALSEHERDCLIEFLKTLQVLPPGTESSIVDEKFRPRLWAGHLRATKRAGAFADIRQRASTIRAGSLDARPPRRCCGRPGTSRGMANVVSRRKRSASMTRALTLAAAFVLLLAGAPSPAGAQPVPLEGPAINPSIYNVPAGAKTINVDCDAQQTLSKAIADPSTADLNIVFSGTCKEYVYLQRDGVAIRGKDATATITGAIEVTSARRVLFEGFTCRDNAQLESCIGALHGASVTLHNIKVFNSSVRGIGIINSTALIEGLTVDKTVSTSVLIRGSDARMEGELTFSNTIEGCLVIDGVSSVFTKSGVINARDCAGGILIQNNSSLQAPFATLTLNANSYAGLALVSQGTLSFGGAIVAKNNGKTGIFVDDGSSFSPFTNLIGTSSITLENNGQAGITVLRGSIAELANVAANTGSLYGVYVDEASVRIGRSKIADNTKADVRLQFGARASFLEGVAVGTLSCDGSALVRGSKTPCTPDPKPGATTAAAGQADKP